MRKLVLVAAMLMASASAHAGSNSYSFNIEGHKVRVSVPRNCTSLSCISISAPSLVDKFKTKDEDDEPAASTKPAPATAAPAPAAAPAATAAAPAPAAQPSQAVQPSQAAQPALEAPAPVVSSKVTVMPAPATETYSTSGTAAAPAPVAAPAPAPAVVASAPVAAPASPAPAAAAPVAVSPIGLWMSEKKEGKIRVEDCNGNLCGYAVDAKTGANGAKVLINMKPRGDKWTGRIHDTRSGGTYDSTVAMRGTDKLRVQGCAFGGMFCGGETWTRIE